MFQDVGLDQQEEGLGGSSQHIQSVGLGRLGRIEHNPRSHPLWSGDDLRTAPTDGFQFLTNVHFVSMISTNPTHNNILHNDWLPPEVDLIDRPLLLLLLPPVHNLPCTRSSHH